MNNSGLAKKVCDAILTGNDALKVLILVDKFAGRDQALIKRKENVYLVIPECDIDELMLLSESQFIEMTKKMIRRIYDEEAIRRDGDVFEKPIYPWFTLPFHPTVMKLLKIR
jgi:hypothetical protein